MGAAEAGESREPICGLRILSIDSQLAILTTILCCSKPQVSEIIKEMGIPALFTRGLGLRIFMVGSLTGLQWGIYDAYKVSVGLPTTGSAAPAAGEKK